MSEIDSTASTTRRPCGLHLHHGRLLRAVYKVSEGGLLYMGWQHLPTTHDWPNRGAGPLIQQRTACQQLRNGLVLGPNAKPCTCITGARYAKEKSADEADTRDVVCYRTRNKHDLYVKRDRSETTRIENLCIQRRGSRAVKARLSHIVSCMHYGRAKTKADMVFDICGVDSRDSAVISDLGARLYLYLL
jgi:hypothetical protein